MGGFSMNKVLGNLKKRQTFSAGKGAFPWGFSSMRKPLWASYSPQDADVLSLATDSVAETPADHANDTPDSIAARCVV